MDDNPWLSAAPVPLEQPSTVAAEVDAAHELDVSSQVGPPSGPQAPQPFVPAAPGPALPRHNASGPPALWWMGVHGGAGESTLAALSDGGRAAGGAWPIAGSGHQHAVVLVARTHHHGLERARQAAIEWAGGQPDVRLLGLALVADAPGRLPKPLRDLAALVAGGVPRVWHVPWVEAWRMEPAGPHNTPHAVRRLLAQTTALFSSSAS
ncbi:hypothetical protein SAMN02745673_00926 [Marinactinospora thermotolerans DSM 45154]|uniref:Uncharacterized protein n=1 Tax=Marinactinospora thermotolerans DSM 45154 TaxID=1122192 RepID=A0A1T4M3J6_9ACTN|nr:DUF6668 family protein [Marinactinospora thermotolerans]SJZ61446.1 hypothetical protein SAMN02745673_00926 [Marinactinospora thermotolerans DSM 45154]